MNKKYSIFLMLVSIFILQWHGIIFWLERAGLIGVAWSLIIEISAIWLWWQRQKFFTFMGFVATALVIAAPLYQVSMPLLVGDNVRIAQVTQLQTTQQQLLKNSQNRAGWAGEINSTRNALLKTRQNILSNTQKIATLSVVVNQQTWLIIIKIIALLVFQILNISIINQLSNPIVRKDKKTNISNFHHSFLKFFEQHNTDRALPNDIAEDLNMTAEVLAKQLKPLGIHTKKIRMVGVVKTGYSISCS